MRSILVDFRYTAQYNYRNMFKGCQALRVRIYNLCLTFTLKHFRMENSYDSFTFSCYLHGLY